MGTSSCRLARPGSGVTAARPAPLFSASTGHRIAGLLQSPATGVDFPGAALYCAAMGGRLPWAEELEAAASGQEGRLYAWGRRLRFRGPGPTSTPGATRPGPVVLTRRRTRRRGVHDLNGNAMEWSAGSVAVPAEIRQPAAHGAPAVRARAREVYALNAAWLPIEPATRSHHLGFRCVYDCPAPREAALGRPDGRATCASRVESIPSASLPACAWPGSR